MVTILDNAENILEPQDFLNFQRLHAKDSTEILDEEEDREFLRLRKIVNEGVRERDRLKDLENISKYSLEDVFRMYFIVGKKKTYSEAVEALRPALKIAYGDAAKVETVHFADVTVKGTKVPFYLGTKNSSEVTEAFGKLTTDKQLFDHLTEEGKSYLKVAVPKKRGEGHVYTNFNSFLATRKQFSKEKLAKLLDIEVSIRKPAK